MGSIRENLEKSSLKAIVLRIQSKGWISLGNLSRQEWMSECQYIQRKAKEESIKVIIMIDNYILTNHT